NPRLFMESELLVVSPGISLRHPAIAAAITHGVEVVGDVELFARNANAPIIAVTGSNGKSTVTLLVGELCKAAGLKTLVGGNIGTPVLDLLELETPDIYVLELSSFQLETTHSLKLVSASILNLTMDHMDRYSDMASYVQAKARIFSNCKRSVVNRDDSEVMACLSKDQEYISFGQGLPNRAGDYGIDRRKGDDWIVKGDLPIFPVKVIPLPGKHNAVNVAAALALTESLNLPKAAIETAIRQFKGLPHRCEVVAEHKGVVWINDSKGTNVGATVAALEGFDRKVILIAGGEGKNADFTPLAAPVRRLARSVILFGRDSDLIANVLDESVEVEVVTTLHSAVQSACKGAHPGDVVLFSPACASFDMFSNFEERGNAFCEAVLECIG
ncbi:UDP-N-acetylmuramoyl-L-alanine--D-glutamate ligase, partial [Pseudomonadota bacterium]